ncbi:hypothetical protein HaLaN_06116, partial [Haematococcus lacustris]
MHPGSPGYVAISIDPSLQASHVGPLTSLHPTPPDMSSLLSGTALASVVQTMLAHVAALSRVPLFTLMASFPASTSAQPLLPVAAAVAHHSCSSGLAWVSVDSSKPAMLGELQALVAKTS